MRRDRTEPLLAANRKGLSMVVTLKKEEEQVRTATLPTPASSEVFAAPIAVEAATVEAVNTAPPLATSTRRYDQATIERALALAAAMQEEHQATLTAEQVVRLGEEMNVDPTFVLKALSRLNAEEQATVEAASEKRNSVSRTVTTSFRALPRTDKVAAVLVPLVFSALSYCVFREMSFDNWYSPLFLIVGAPLLAIFLGVRLRSKRLGLASGALLGFLMAVALWLTVDYPQLGDVLMFVLGWTLAFVAIGASLGGLSAVITLHGARMYRQLAAALGRYFPGLAEPDAGA